MFVLSHLLNCSSLHNQFGFDRLDYESSTFRIGKSLPFFGQQSIHFYDFTIDKILNIRHKFNLCIINRKAGKISTEFATNAAQRGLIQANKVDIFQERSR